MNYLDKTFSFFTLLVLFFFLSACDEDKNGPTAPGDSMMVTDTIRFASYNVSMFGNEEGDIINRLQSATAHTNYLRVGAIIQNTRPDVLVLMELDFDAQGQALKLLKEQLLEISYSEADTIHYQYAYQIESNTGVISQVDLDGNGAVSLPNDAFGFGNFPGQYASAILSRFPLDVENSRSFRNFLWKEMPDAAIPVLSDGSPYYSQEAWDIFRLSSKNHMDLPIVLPGGNTIHALISHPTPPVFDGAEDRNGKRNHDEIRLWKDYINNETYLKDDSGVSGGLSSNESFIIFGDLNADPLDGDSYQNAINQLLNDPRVHQEVSNGALIPSSNGGAEHNQQSGNSGDPAHDTAFFGLRIDYVLPSADLNPIASGVFWPSSTEENYDLTQNGAASDHLLVWLDVEITY